MNEQHERGRDAAEDDRLDEKQNIGHAPNVGERAAVDLHPTGGTPHHLTWGTRELKKSSCDADTYLQMADAIVRLDVPEEAPTAQVRPGSVVGEPAPARTPLGTLLREAGFIGEQQLEEALRDGASTGERLGEVVVRRGWATEDDIAKLLAEQWGLGYVDRASIWFDANALSRMSREQAQRLEALPTRVQDGRVVVAVAEPSDERLAALREVIGEDTVVVVVPKSALDAGLRSELLEAEERSDGVAEVRADPIDPPRPVQEPARSTPAAAPRRVEAHGELGDVLRRLDEAALEAAALQQRVGELARQLGSLSAGLAAVAERLDGAAADRAKIDRLEEQLGQRTELTDRLKSQLVDLTRTLENLD